MADGSVSDASPPRRRPRRGNTKYSANHYRSSLSGHSHHPLVPQQSSDVPRISPSRRRREAPSNSRTMEHDLVVEGARTPVKEDVSDASPPRRRRRIDYTSPPHPASVSNANRSSLTVDATRAKDPSRRGSMPVPTINPEENASMRSTAVSRDLHPYHNHYDSHSTSGRMRPVSTAKAPRNRFAIEPGPRWDGVNRTNGFEERLDAIKSMRQDVALEGYRASVADL